MFIIIVLFPCSVLPSLNSLSVSPYLISLYDHIYENSVPHSPDFICILRAFICQLSVHVLFSVNTIFLCNISHSMHCACNHLYVSISADKLYKITNRP
jgi:hypothetical protein